MNIHSIGLLIAIGVLPLVVIGCKPTTSIHGTVTYNGQTVEKGSISFMPEDGRGPASGSQIVNGGYLIASLLPGRKIVRVVSVREADNPRNIAEMAQHAQTIGRKRGLTFKVVDEIPANTIGNNVAITVNEGRQKMDFELKRPGSY